MSLWENLLTFLEYKNDTFYWKQQMTSRALKGEQAGYLAQSGYRYINFHNQLVAEHQLVFFINHGYVPDVIDHIDRNRTNNSIDNLRSCTTSQNACNAFYSSNTSGVKNVYYDKSRDKWKVIIHKDKKAHHFGRFTSFEEACLVAEANRQVLHGEFAL